jgi:2-amino-4-hydroxy-6-hydroxymethyldihydropteridine diphosphokinase
MPTVYVSIGSNVDREHNIRSSVNALKRYFTGLRLSSVYETEAQGFVGDPFYNLVVGFDTEKTVDEVMVIFRSIENQHGRRRGEEKFSPRTLDLDLLLYGQQIFKDKDIPRAEITRYEFVLLPLAEIAPDLIHPVLQTSLHTLWDRFKTDHAVTNNSIHAIEFQWEESVDS